MMLAHTGWLDAPAVRTLLHVFAAEGAPIRFVGGCVRDALLGRTVHDMDCATPLPPQDVMALLERAGLRCIPTGLAHGTVTARIEQISFEITTLRRDTQCDGRHATVDFTSDWQEDAARRDFTMNALYCDASGIIYDYMDGIADAQAGRVRFIGTAADRIIEDALRILRFFRFCASHGKAPYDSDALAACRSLAPTMAALSGERIQQEMVKLLSTPHCLTALESLVTCGIAPHIACPPQLPTAALQILDDTSLLMHLSAPHRALLRLAVWLHSASQPAHMVAERWRFSGEHRHLLHTLITTEALPDIASQTDLIRQLRLHGTITLPLLLLRDLAQGHSQSQPLASLFGTISTQELPLFPVTGDDLKQQGFTQGKAMGDTLKHLEGVWESSGYTMNKDELLNQLNRQ